MPKFSDLITNLFKEIRGNAVWDLIKIAALGITAISAGIWLFWQSVPQTYKLILWTSIFWLLCLPAVYFSRKYWKAKKTANKLKKTGTLTILGISDDNISKSLKSSSVSISNQAGNAKKLSVNNLIPGFLDINCVLSHQVSEKVISIRDEGNKIIPTKYLFAHANSYNFYNELRDDFSYSIRESETFFGKDSKALADCLADLLGAKRELHIVSLGIGIGRKERALIQALGQKQVKLSMLAIDINPSFINESFKHLRKEIDKQNINFNILIGDFDRIDKYGLSLPKDRPILFLALGGTFGNQIESNLLNNLKSVCQGIGESTEKYLLIDFQTKESLRDANTGGYDSLANKRFIQNIIKVFCEEESDLDNIQARYYRDLPELHSTNLKPSSIEESETIVMVGENNNRQKRYVGYSTRYEKESLKKFFEERQCSFVKMFSHPEFPHTSLLLYKI